MPIVVRVLDILFTERGILPGKHHISHSRELPDAIGEVIDVIYLNDHVVMALPEASDHGQVLARIRLFDEARGLMDAGV